MTRRPDVEEMTGRRCGAAIAATALLLGGPACATVGALDLSKLPASHTVNIAMGPSGCPTAATAVITDPSEDCGSGCVRARNGHTVTLQAQRANVNSKDAFSVQIDPFAGIPPRPSGSGNLVLTVSVRVSHEKTYPYVVVVPNPTCAPLDPQIIVEP